MGSSGVIPGPERQRGSPESIPTVFDYGFRARRTRSQACAGCVNLPALAPRNDQLRVGEAKRAHGLVRAVIFRRDSRLCDAGTK